MHYIESLGKDDWGFYGEKNDNGVILRMNHSNNALSLVYKVGGNVLIFFSFNHIQDTDTDSPLPKTSQKVLSSSNSISSRHSKYPYYLS